MRAAWQQSSNTATLSVRAVNSAEFAALAPVGRNDALQLTRPGRRVGPVSRVIDDHRVVGPGAGDEPSVSVEDPGAGGVPGDPAIDGEAVAGEQGLHRGDVVVHAGET
jgi:hypothetical protein